MCLVSDLRFSYKSVRMDHPGVGKNIFAKKEYSRAPILISRLINDILDRVGH